MKTEQEQSDIDDDKNKRSHKLYRKLRTLRDEAEFGDGYEQNDNL